MGIFNKLFNGSAKSFDGVGGYSLTSVFGNSSMYKQYSQEELLSMYKGWIFATSDAIGDGMGMLPMSLYKNKDKTDSINHKYMDLIDSQMIKAISIFLKTLGEVYIYKAKAGKQVQKLYLLKGWNVVEKTGDFGEVLYYTYTDGTTFYRFEKEDVIAFKTFSPIFAQAGMTPLRAAASQMAMDISSIEYNRLFFENGGKPGTVLKSQSKIDSDVRDKYLAKWKQNFVGLQNSNKVAFLDQGIDIVDFSANQKDMELTNQRTFTRDEILMMFRVGTPILGKSDGVGFADKKVPGYYFTQYTLKPLGELIKDGFNKRLFDGIGYFSFDFPEDQDDLLKEYQANTITLNEYRISTGKLPVKDGNVLWDGTEAIVEETKSVSRETGLKAIEENIEKSLNESVKKKEFGTEEYNQKIWEVKITRTDVYENKMSKIQKKIWNAQEKDILANLEEGSKGFGIKEIKKEDDLFDEDKYSILYATLYNPFFIEMMGKEGEIAIEEISDEEFAVARLNKWIGENIDRMSGDIDDTTRKEIFEIIKEGNREGLGADAIAASVRKKFNQYTRKTGRIEKVVRTEVTRASNKSQEEAYSQSGVVEEKEWYTALDERVAPECQILHGKKIKIGGIFLKKGEKDSLGNKVTYESIRFPPRHVNCRCTLRPIISQKSFKEVKERFEKKGINLKNNI